MQISTAGFYRRAATRMADLNATTERLMTEISTRKVNVASDDATGWTRLGGIARDEAADGAYKANVTLARGLLAQTDTALEGVSDRLVRVRELAINANSGTPGTDGRAAIATELEAIRDDLLSLANSRDVRGQPVFGGTGEAAYAKAANGSIAYTGTAEVASVPIGTDSSVQVGADGARVFGGADGTTDVFAMIAALSTALRDPQANLPRAVSDALEGLGKVETQVTTARASTGARAARLEVESARLDTVALDREEARVAIEATDVPTAMVELQQTMLVLQATQASVTKLAGMSLFDHLK
ncbi:flagellar biosynthesis protein FlgL [Sphingomonas sp. VNH70]|uniref:flagellin N-terminal helical domain-containing protein n=1 Tax=Sphingomonas silueang TaxID=3156617 RepID=UPI0032B42B4D